MKTDHLKAKDDTQISNTVIQMSSSFHSIIIAGKDIDLLASIIELAGENRNDFF